VYKYATGLVSAINIVENLKSGKISVDDYKKFLSSGCIKDPITLLKIVKVDLTTDEPFNVAFSYFETKLKAFKRLTSKK
jgi:oligoendopeptidase F